MAGIIKAGHEALNLSGSQPTAFRFVDVTQQSAAHLAAARAQAAEILAKAQRDAEALKHKAEQQGLQAAMAKAQQLKRQELAAQLDTLVPALQQMVRAIEDARHALTRTWESALVRIACKIAERIIRRQVAIDREIPLRLIHECLELATGQGKVRIELHPDDYSALGEEAQRLAETLGRGAAVEFVPCDEIAKGSCRARTEFGTFDQRFEAQLQRIEEELNA